MQLVRSSPANRSKVIAVSEPSVFFTWNSTNSCYEFVLQIYDNATGMKFKVKAKQLEWTKTIAELQKQFGEAPA